MLLLVLTLGIAPAGAQQQERTEIRVGVLQYGTVQWLLEVVQDLDLARARGVDLTVVPLAQPGASTTALTTALEEGAVDMIVSDWLWVSRQRAAGGDYTFVPYSLAVGGLLVHPLAEIDTLADLAGRTIGVAGGPVDKSWLLLRAYTKRTLGWDIARRAEVRFAAPPLLNKLILDQELPAVLNFWHYGARLKAVGMEELIGVREILPALGVAGDVPLLGWVFREDWALANRQAVEAFIEATRTGQQLMKESDALWDLIQPLIGVDDQATLVALREGYRAGIPESFAEAEIAAAQRVYELLAAEGGAELVGASTTLAPGTFWTPEADRIFRLLPYGMKEEGLLPDGAARNPPGGEAAQDP